MARTIRRSTRQDEGTKQRGLTDQPTPFVGLAVSPLIALVVSWGIHFLIAGVTWGDRVILSGSPSFLAVAISLVTLAAAGLAYAAWLFSKGRMPAVRYALVASVFVVVEWIAILIGVGPHRWWGTFFVLIAWGVAALWALPRLHVLRRDPHENADDATEDTLLKQLGLDGYKAASKPDIVHDPKTGEVARMSVEVKHRFGGTRAPLQAAIDNLASALGTKDGFVRVTAPDDGKSNRSVITAVLKDPFVGRVPDLGLTSPGGSCAGPATVGLYDDGEPALVWVCGGNDADGNPLNPSAYMFMGMSRAGKTVTENRLLIDGAITRNDATILYLNKAKGGQDIGPIIAGVEASVLSDNNADYKQALKEVKNIMTYRQQTLARYGIAAWSAEKCFHNPPTHTLDGNHNPMEPMCALWVHMGEADAALEHSADEAVYVASKGLSLGVIPGYSLQRAAATSMPTDLRYNLGTVFCFGTGDDYSAGFALSEQTIKAGAHPEYWKNRKPGMFYLENVGVDENRFPVPAKGIGDTDNDALYINMRLTCEEWGPRMAKLDRGSANATRGWWDKHVRETDALRASMAPNSTANMTPTDVITEQEDTRMSRTPAVSAATFQIDDGATGYDPDAADLATDTAAQIAETTEIEGQNIHGDLIKPDELDPEFAELNSIDPRKPITPPATDDGIDLRGPKPDPQSREEAELALDDALRSIANDPAFIDPDDERYVVFRTGELQKRYPFRARSWYSPMLAALANGQRECPPGLHVQRHPDRTGDGWYRMNRLPDQQV